MDLSSPTSTPNSPLTPVFGDNVQDLLGTGTINVNPSAIITVNSIADTVNDLNSGVTTLRDAINQANADDGEDLIVFDRSLFSSQQTITLSGIELYIAHNLDIIAPRDPLTGGDLVTVSGNKATRVFEIGSLATVSIDGLIVTDGNVTGAGSGGGGIKNSGTLTLDNSTLSGNSGLYGSGIWNTGTLTVSTSTLSGNGVSLGGVGGIANGGGIYNTGTLTVSTSTLSSNAISAHSGTADGGGIYNTGTLTVSTSTLSGNSANFSSGSSGGSGGGIFNSGGILVINDSTISGNSANSGGGISGGNLNGSGILVINNSTISGNRALVGGGIFTSGTLTLTNSTISGNKAFISGGGIAGGILNVTNSTISSNSASDRGGGIAGSILNVTNSTISSNSANSGGGIYGGTVTLSFSTITLNQAFSGSGVFITSGPAMVRNTIIASNLPTANGINPDVSGTFTSYGYNLIGDSTGSTGFSEGLADIVGTSDNPIDPRLAPLDFNGGPTQNFALLPDSPAIGAGDPTVLDTDPTTDQRGLPRRAADGKIDIGAFQFS